MPCKKRKGSLADKTEQLNRQTQGTLRTWHFSLAGGKVVTNWCCKSEISK